MEKETSALARQSEAITRQFEKMRTTSKALDALVESELEDRNTVEELNELIEALPKEYRGDRRIYEKMERIAEREEGKPTEPEKSVSCVVDLRGLSEVERCRRLDHEFASRVARSTHIGPCKVPGRMVGRPTDAEIQDGWAVRSFLPRYSESQDALMPYLDNVERLNIDRVVQPGIKKPVLWRVSIEGRVTAIDVSLAMAACMCLLRASGVEVLL